MMEISLFFMRIDLMTSFLGPHIIADNHFRAATKFFDKLVLVTNKSNAGRPRIIRGKRVPHSLSAEDQEKNEAIAFVRGKVESPYGWCKQTFAALSCPFYEDKDQHNCLINFALACHKKLVNSYCPSPVIFDCPSQSPKR